MLKLDVVEMYITNVCNLACDNCNRFNNFAFKGHQRWQDNAEEYKRWSKICEIRVINIMGGEPLTNPDVLTYVKEVRKLWPRAEIYIVTNGTHMHKVKAMLDDLRKNNIGIKISLHSKQLASKILSDLDDILAKPISVDYQFLDYHIRSWQTSYDNIRGIDWPDCPTPYDFVSLPQHIQDECRIDFDFTYEDYLTHQASRVIIDSQGFKIEVNWYDHFHESAVKFDQDSNEIKLHNSDPIKAVEICDQKFCHNFNNGKLYKCGPAALLPEFVKQFKIELKNDDIDVINSYQPASPQWSIDKINDFLLDLNKGNHIPQCKFCPQSYNSKRLANTLTKPKIAKR